MPPRKNKTLNEIHEQELEDRVMARIEERFDPFVDQLSDRMDQLMNRRGNHNVRGIDDEQSENPFGEDDDSSSNEQSGRRPRQNQREDNRRWESRMRVNIPDFAGDTLSPEGASAWWQQLKLTRERVGKPRITSWQKMKKCMRANFIPHNYQRQMYQRLQNLKQGSKSVEDYTTEFYQLIARNDIQEIEDQLVSRYIGGLRVQIMDSVNMFDPMTLSDAYQRALAFEKQNRRVGSSSSPAITGASGSGNVASRFAPSQAKAGGGNTGPVSRASGSSGLKCFNCGEPGHRQSECKKAGKRHLFADPEGDDDAAYEEYEEAPVYDEEPECEEEYVSGDVGVNLVVRRSCLTPKADGDDWLKHNIFQSTCTISGKVCTFVCDSGSCDNLIAAEAVQKLGLKTENHPKPYKLQWLKKGGEVTVSKRVHVPFSVGNTYKDNVWCDVVPMDACHLLLGRPWEYDRDITHNGRTNTYSFLFGGVKITLMPNKPKEVISKPTGTLLTLSQFEDELEMGDDVFVLIGKEVAEDSEIPEAMIPLLEEFSDVFPDELPDGLPPLRDIQHHIDLEPGSQLPNMPHYRISPGGHEELRRQVEELVSKGHVRESMSPCAVPALLTPKKVEDFVAGVHDVHKAVHENLVRANSKYKQDADHKRRHVDFEEGDFVWAVLTKDRFPVGEYNKLSAKKIGPLDIVEKINSNAYRLKLPSHIRCSDVFNVKHLIP
ncbi:putative nucleotidyltransferase, ribonuclease H [Tanacetum coccineum]